MSVNIYFDPLDITCKNIIGAVKAGEVVQLTLFSLKEATPKKKYGYFHSETPKEEDCCHPSEKAYFRFCKDGEAEERIEMQKTSFGWTISFTPYSTGLYYYGFHIENVGNVICDHLECGSICDCRSDMFLLTVYSHDYQTPEWFKGGVMYQIFPDRFCKAGSMPDIKGRIERKWGEDPYFRPNAQGKVLNNDFFGGNFKGIESKLDYLQNLGVTVLYLNPIFEAASNHRYDTSDYMKIDKILGSEEDFQHLVNAAKEKGIRVILDGVFNHTGDDSVYFNKYGNYPSIGAYQSKESPYYTWYSFQEFPNKYSSWWGIDILPEVNENSKEYQEFIFGKEGVLWKWLDFGIGGYRLDVADELPDFFLKKLRKSVKEKNPDAIIIGEVWEDASNKIAYSQRREYLHGYELDSVMNYPLKDAIIHYIQTGNAINLLHTIRVLINHYPKPTLDCLMNILGTHDTSRILTVLGGIYCRNKEEMACDWAKLQPDAKQKAMEKLKMAAVLQFTMPGIPCIYYGDENGMEGHIDPFCRRCFPWDNLNENLISFYQKLGEIRKNYQNIFKDGNFHEICADEGLFIFKRENNFGTIYVYVNNSSKNYQLELSNKMQDCLTNQNVNGNLVIQPNSYGILYK